MKSMVYMVLASLVFVAILSVIVGQNNSLSQRIAAISEAHAATTESKNVLQFPVEVNFKRAHVKEDKPLFARVAFSHFDHQTVACTACHHTWDGKGKVEGCATAGCHDNVKQKVGSDTYFFAYHAASSEHSCRGCHKKLADEGNVALKTSPCSNNVCHPKKS